MIEITFTYIIIESTTNYWVLQRESLWISQFIHAYAVLDTLQPPLLLILGRIYEQKCKQLKYPLWKINIKGKATFLWFESFLWEIIINFISAEKEFIKI